ncbi:MAG TPA: 4-hydroxybenzoyl-CoA reductase subunit beta, partial [Casimicrobiaceae bacterium]|nr:4-hydroxybenzoyl-CoA reductase subunit beta [Casimicrobiaceae bacterium]
AALLAAPGSRIIAGGTDLVPNLRRGLEQPTTLVDLRAIDALGALQQRDGTWTIGAAVTLARLASDPGIAAAHPAVAQAAVEIAAPAHRNAATVGGNLCLDTRCVFYNQSAWWRAANRWCLKRGGDTCHVAPQGARCHAAFSGDLAPALMVAGAEVEIVSAAGARRLALAQLYRDDGAAHLTLAPGEMLVAVHLPRAVGGVVSGYRKARVRGSFDFPLAGVAVALARDGDRIAQLRVALTGTNSHPLLLEGTDALAGRAIDDETLERLGKLVAKQVSPMRTTVTASNYRRQVASVLAQRLLRDLAAGRRAAHGEEPPCD